MTYAAAVEFTVNGEPHSVPAGTTVEGVVSRFTSTKTGFAVARNGEVVPRSAWSNTAITPGDRVDVVTVAQGG